jgi:hypothetical protein
VYLGGVSVKRGETVTRWLNLIPRDAQGHKAVASLRVEFVFQPLVPALGLLPVSTMSSVVPSSTTFLDSFPCLHHVYVCVVCINRNGRMFILSNVRIDLRTECNLPALDTCF